MITGLLWFLAGFAVFAFFSIGHAIEQRWVIRDRQHRELLVALDRLKPYDERLYDACGERVML